MVGTIPSCDVGISGEVFRRQNGQTVGMAGVCNGLGWVARGALLRGLAQPLLLSCCVTLQKSLPSVGQLSPWQSEGK